MIDKYIFVMAIVYIIQGLAGYKYAMGLPGTVCTKSNSIRVNAHVIDKVLNRWSCLCVKKQNLMFLEFLLLPVCDILWHHAVNIFIWFVITLLEYNAQILYITCIWIFYIPWLKKKNYIHFEFDVNHMFKKNTNWCRGNNRLGKLCRKSTCLNQFTGHSLTVSSVVHCEDGENGLCNIPTVKKRLSTHNSI